VIGMILVPENFTLKSSFKNEIASSSSISRKFKNKAVPQHTYGDAGR
jgi:hypothetical protein